MAKDQIVAILPSAFMLAFILLVAVWHNFGLTGALMAGILADRIIMVDFGRRRRENEKPSAAATPARD